MRYRTLVIDDERLARLRLQTLLEAHRDRIELIGEAAHGDEAVVRIDRDRPDLVFLDIQMPEVDGFEVLERIRVRPLVVFVTAFDEHALKAFDAHAVDYLLKPVEPERLAEALDNIRRLAERPDAARAALDHLLAHRAPTLNRLSVPVGDRTFLIDLDDVAFFAADHKYTSVHTLHQSYLISTPLVDLENRLDPGRFMRIHRSTIVNLAFVHEIYRPSRGKLRVILRDTARTELDVGRSYQARVRAL